MLARAHSIPTQTPIARLMLSRRWMVDCLKGVDFFTIVFCALASHLIYQVQFLGQDADVARYLTIGLVLASVNYLVLHFQNAYSFNDTTHPHMGLLLKVLLSITLVFTGIIVFAYLFKIAHFYSRGWVLISWSFMVILLTINRAVFRLITRQMMQAGGLSETVAIFGDETTAKAIAEKICSKYSPFRFAGIFSNEQSKTSSGNLKQLIQYGQTHKLDHVVVALPLDRGGEIQSCIQDLQSLPVELSLYVDFSETGMRPKSIVHFPNADVLMLKPKPIKEWNYVLKRAEDIAVALVALILFAPVIAAVAIAIRMEGPGPIFFRQRRHGFNHQTINVLKFRTMNVWEDGDHIKQAEREDKRITRVGGILRKTSLDELPQLINVLQGEMSVVGPRPHALAHNAHYSKLIGDYDTRHKIKPGITGWAQVNGYRGETREPSLMKKRVDYDIEYIDNWSLWLDLKILVRTLRCGFIDKRAY
ncbi:MAG: undecaprenyl-phosphate glucose phosphotransferase [Pseudomonadota bacterium]